MIHLTAAMTTDMSHAVLLSSFVIGKRLSHLVKHAHPHAVSGDEAAALQCTRVMVSRSSCDSGTKAGR